MATRQAIAVGCTPSGAPIVGWVADRVGPRWALGLGAASGFAAAIVGIHYLKKYGHLHLRLEAGRLRFSIDDGEPMTNSALSVGNELHQPKLDCKSVERNSEASVIGNISEVNIPSAVGKKI